MLTRFSSAPRSREPIPRLRDQGPRKEVSAVRPTMRSMARTEDRGTAGSVRSWRQNVYDRAPERSDELFTTISGLEPEPLHTPENVDLDYGRDLGYPGELP